MLSPLDTVHAPCCSTACIFSNVFGVISHKTEFKLQLTRWRTWICQAKTNLPNFALSASKNFSVSIEQFQNFCDWADWNVEQPVHRREKHLERSLSISRIKRKHHK